jgi:sedoheptulose-bisphosphatase
MSTTLQQHLETLLPDERSALRDSVLPTLLDSIASIAGALSTSHNVSQVGTANAFGDDQLNVDVLAEQAVRDAISKCPSIITASSEEDPVERTAGHDQPVSTIEKYTVAFDPLDGSSIIGPNWTIGTIIGVWDGETALNHNPAEAQVAAILGVCGPRTSAIVALRLPGEKGTCFELSLGSGKVPMIIQPVVMLDSPPFKQRYFAPANLRAAADEPKYMELVTKYVRDKYTLRYSGGLVPDVVHMLIKKHGVYISPVTVTSKPKLRRLFELYPIALIVECAGGKALDPATGIPILDTAVDNVEAKAGLLCGTAGEVDFAAKQLIDQPFIPSRMRPHATGHTVPNIEV